MSVQYHQVYRFGVLSSPHSFGMAYDFIDCIGDDVDVVSDSEVCGAVRNNTSIFVTVFLSYPCSITSPFLCRTSRSFWKYLTASPMSVWQFTVWVGPYFWTNWTFRSCSWDLLRYDRVQTMIMKSRMFVGNDVLQLNMDRCAWVYAKSCLCVGCRQETGHGSKTFIRGWSIRSGRGRRRVKSTGIRKQFCQSSSTTGEFWSVKHKTKMSFLW